MCSIWLGPKTVLLDDSDKMAVGIDLYHLATLLEISRLEDDTRQFHWWDSGCHTAADWDLSELKLISSCDLHGGTFGSVHECAVLAGIMIVLLMFPKLNNEFL